MTGNDIAEFRPRSSDLTTALGLLTRLPMPMSIFTAGQIRPASHAAWAYPMIGGVIALLSGFAGWLALSLGLPPSAAALFVLVASIASTGAMHEDGLADCSDGFWGQIDMASLITELSEEPLTNQSLTTWIEMARVSKSERSDNITLVIARLSKQPHYLNRFLRFLRVKTLSSISPSNAKSTYSMTVL